MPYTAHEWHTKDIVTSDLLNRIETGIADVSTSATTANTACTNLSNRIDNLILDSGDSNIEVVDAHVGVDGTQYASLKARLDTEIGGLQEAVGEPLIGILTPSTSEGVTTYTCSKTYTELKNFKGKSFFKLGTKQILITEIESDYIGATFIGVPEANDPIVIIRIKLKSDNSCEVVVNNRLTWGSFVGGK